MNKILTIIIPTYNMEKYLRRCLDSLIIDEEGMKQLEVLVINDGSKDSSSQIAHEYQDKYPDTYRVIDKENGNYGSCINRGLKEATGKYVKVLDADDWFDNEKLRVFLMELANTDVDVALTGFSIVNGKNLKETPWKIGLPKNKTISFKQFINSCPLGMMMHGVCYKLEMVKAINYVQPEGISYTDQIWINEPMAHAKTIIYFPLSLYKYLVGRSGQTMDPNILKKNICHQIECAKVMIKTIQKVPFGSLSYNYLEYRAIHTTCCIYLSFLTDETLDLSILEQFDNDIKKINSRFYNNLNEVVFHPFIRSHYIKNWRNDLKRKKTDKYLQKISYFLYKFFYRKHR